MSWGSWGKNLSTQEQSDLIKYCVNNGNTTFDHADIYGDYTTEREFGKSLKESGVNRNNIKIISKCGIQLISDNKSHRIKHYNFSKKHIVKSVEQSLKNLNTDYLDHLLLHRPSPLMDINEITEAVTHLLDSGKIKEFGVSNFNPQQVDLISTKNIVSTNQIEFSLTSPDPMFNGILDQVQQTKIQAMCWSPLGNVFKEKTEQTIRVKTVLSSLSTKYNLEKDTILYSWLLKHPANVSPVIGTTNKHRIQNANKALAVQLDLEDWFSLLAASTGEDVP